MRDDSESREMQMQMSLCSKSQDRFSYGTGSPTMAGSGKVVFRLGSTFSALWLCRSESSGLSWFSSEDLIKLEHRCQPATLCSTPTGLSADSVPVGPGLCLLLSLWSSSLSHSWDLWLQQRKVSAKPLI